MLLLGDQAVPAPTACIPSSSTEALERESSVSSHRSQRFSLPPRRVHRSQTPRLSPAEAPKAATQGPELSCSQAAHLPRHGDRLRHPAARRSHTSAKPVARQLDRSRGLHAGATSVVAPPPGPCPGLLLPVFSSTSPSRNSLSLPVLRNRSKELQRPWPRLRSGTKPDRAPRPDPCLLELTPGPPMRLLAMAAVSVSSVSSESVRSVRIRSTMLVRPLHGPVLLPNGISVAGTGKSMI